MPTYLGIIVFIFSLLWSNVGDSQYSKDKKVLRLYSSGQISNCRVTPRK